MVATQAKLFQWGALGYQAGASVFFAFMPLLPVSTADGTAWVAPFRILGWSVFLPLLLPLALTLVPLVVRGRYRLRVAWSCTAVLAVLSLLLTVTAAGLLFLPAPLLAASGAFLAGRAPIEDAPAEDRPWEVPKA